MISPLAAAIAELLATPAVAAKVGARVRPFRPAAGDSAVPYVRFVVLSYLDAGPTAHMGIRGASLSMRCYGISEIDAEDLWQTCEAVFRDRGARIVGTSRIGVYHSRVLGMSMDQDPNTAQPYAMGAIDYPAAIATVPV